MNITKIIHHFINLSLIWEVLIISLILVNLVIIINWSLYWIPVILIVDGVAVGAYIADNKFKNDDGV